MTRYNLLAGLSVVAGLAVAATGFAVAQDAIAQRKALMKGVGGATKTGADMVKGEVAYDAKKAADAMNVIATGWEPFAKLFPKGTETGGETTAHPRVWETFADMDTKGKKMAADAAAARTAAANGLDAFKAAFGEVTKNCKGCHDVYRVPKK